MRGNFLAVPTDCPQRDERMGWTGDIQVFAPVATFLYNCKAMLASWLKDLAAEQLRDHGGIVHVVVPDALSAANWPITAQAIWGDVAVLLPWDLYQSYGDVSVLSEQWESILAWMDRGIKRDKKTGLWDSNEKQLGDWLDPIAPPDLAGKGRTDPTFVADNYLLHCTRITAEICKVLGKKEEGKRFSRDFVRLRQNWENEYLTKSGRLVADSVTAYALCSKFGLVDAERRPKMIARVKHLVAQESFKVATGFAGTPVVLDAFAACGELSFAYRMLQEKRCPSWLYPITMGATTTLERWNSMLEDGSVNPGSMTS